MRRFTENGTLLKQKDEELGLLKAKLMSLQEHVTNIAENLVSSLETCNNPGDSVNTDSIGSDDDGNSSDNPADDSNDDVSDNESNADLSDNDSIVDLSDDATFARHNVASRQSSNRSYAHALKSPTQSKSKQNIKVKPQDAVGLGTSLIRGLGAKLSKRGIDATVYSYGGSQLPFLRKRVKHVISKRNPPKQVFLQAGGNDAEHHPPHMVIREYDNLIREVRRHAPKSNIVIGKIPLRKFDRDLHENINRVNTYLENRAKRRDAVFFADACPNFPGQFKPEDWVHFKPSGKAIYGDKVASHLVNFQTGMINKRR